MAYKINITSGAPKWDALPVAKLTEFPCGTDYGIFSQAILCFEKGCGLKIRLWSFETKPDENSILSVALSSKDKSFFITCRLTYGKKVVLGGDKNGFKHTESFSGEDLQGIYWGAVFELPLDALKALGYNDVAGGETFYLNLFHKCKVNGEVQTGMLFNAPNADGETTFGEDSFGEFVAVEY